MTAWYLYVFHYNKVFHDKVEECFFEVFRSSPLTMTKGLGKQVDQVVDKIREFSNTDEVKEFIFIGYYLVFEAEVETLEEFQKLVDQRSEES